jgi:transposase-like protein
MEHRYGAVLAVVRDGVNVTEVARTFGVSRQTVHAWTGQSAHRGRQVGSEEWRRRDWG